MTRMKTFQGGLERMDHFRIKAWSDPNHILPSETVSVELIEQLHSGVGNLVRCM